MKKLLISIAAALISSCTAQQYSTEQVTVIPNGGGDTLKLDYKIDWYLFSDYVEFCPERDTCIIRRRAVRVKDGKIYHTTKKAVFIYQ